MDREQAYAALRRSIEDVLRVDRDSLGVEDETVAHGIISDYAVSVALSHPDGLTGYCLIVTDGCCPSYRVVGLLAQAQDLAVPEMED